MKPASYITAQYPKDPRTRAHKFITKLVATFTFCLRAVAHHPHTSHTSILSPHPQQVSSSSPWLSLQSYLPSFYHDEENSGRNRSDRAGCPVFRVSADSSRLSLRVQQCLCVRQVSCHAKYMSCHVMSVCLSVFLLLCLSDCVYKMRMMHSCAHAEAHTIIHTHVCARTFK